MLRNLQDRAWDYVTQNVGRRLYTANPALNAHGSAHDGGNPFRRWDTRWTYYENWQVYEFLNNIVAQDCTKLRQWHNPVAYIANFYANHLWSGNLDDAHPLVFANDTYVDAQTAALRKIWQWSNWQRNKQGVARQAAIFGDMFLKVGGNGKSRIVDGEVVVDRNTTQVFFERLDPRLITDMRVDNRGYITYFRMDIPRKTKSDGTHDKHIYTEIWDKDSATMRAHESREIDWSKPDDLGDLVLSQTFEQYGCGDFIPIVHAPFLDNGGMLGVTSYDEQLPKVNQLNEVVSKAYSRLFAKKRGVLSPNMVDSTGAPVPPPEVDFAWNDYKQSVEGDDDLDLLMVPGMATVNSLDWTVDHSGWIAMVDKLTAEIETNLPEFQLERLSGMSQVAEQTVELLLNNAESRVLEVRTNLESAFTRANMMALTIAQNAKLDGFDAQSIGTYSGGRNDFEHTVASRPVFPVSVHTVAKTASEFAKAGAPPRAALELAGLTDDELAGYDDAETAERARQFSNISALQAQRQRELDNGGNGGNG